MGYPFLYSFAKSVLQKLDQCNLNEFGNPNDIEKDVEMLKGILNHLPSIFKNKTHKYDYDYYDDDYDRHNKSPIRSAIQKCVLGLHDLLDERLHPSFKSSWSDLVHPLIELQDHLLPQSSEQGKSLLSSLSFPLPQIESQDVKANNNLPLHLVPCLAYCALYPQGKRIMRETLVNQWMAEGFLELQAPGSSSGGSGDLELEDIGNRYFMELLSMGVFIKPMYAFGGDSSTDHQAVTIHSCEIHPWMHHVARQMAHEEVWVMSFSRFDTGRFPRFERERRSRFSMYIAFHIDPEQPESVSFDLQSTCLFFVPQIKGNILQRATSCLSKLQILDMAGIEFEKLPPSLGETGRLRYLAFSRNTLLKRLDNINSSSLQTLAVDGCVKLEKVNLENTSHMRHLYYTSKETTLEVHTSTLRILQLSHCSELTWFSFSNSANFTCLRRLRIFQFPRLVSLPDSLDLLPGVEELVFHNCARLDLNYGRALDSLPSLQYMELIGLPKLTKLPAGLRSAKTLLYLMIDNCQSLRSTDHTLLQHLVTLQKLCVYDCPNFSIEPNVFQSLTALQSLDIRNCPNITITSISDAAKDPAPFISHIPELNVDGQQLFAPSASSSREHDAARGKQMPSLGAQTDSSTSGNLPHFILSLKLFKKFKSSQATSLLLVRLLSNDRPKPIISQILLSIPRIFQSRYVLSSSPVYSDLWKIEVSLLS